MFFKLVACVPGRVASRREGAVYAQVVMELAQHARLAVQNEIGWIVGNFAAANGLRTQRVTLMARDRILAFGISRTGKIAITDILRSRG